MSIKLRYQRLKQQPGCQFDDDKQKEKANKASRSSWFSKLRFRFRFRFRLRRVKLRLRRRVKLVSYKKILKRLKESQAHFGDLFGGNYLFVQVNPTSLKCIQASAYGNHDLTYHPSTSRLASY